MITQSKRIIFIILIVVLLLLIPFIAMQFTNEVKWSVFNFIIAGLLLLTTGLACDFVIRKVKKVQSRIIICLLILIALLLVWLELAVGIFGTPISGN